MVISCEKMAYWYSVNKRVRKPKRQSQMDNTQTLATLGTNTDPTKNHG